MKKKILALEEDKIYLLLKVVMFLFDKDSRQRTMDFTTEILPQILLEIYIYILGHLAYAFVGSNLQSLQYTDVGGCNAMC